MPLINFHALTSRKVHRLHGEGKTEDTDDAKCANQVKLT